MACFLFASSLKTIYVSLFWQVCYQLLFLSIPVSKFDNICPLLSHPQFALFVLILFIYIYSSGFYVGVEINTFAKCSCFPWKSVAGRKQCDLIGGPEGGILKVGKLFTLQKSQLLDTQTVNSSSYFLTPHLSFTFHQVQSLSRILLCKSSQSTAVDTTASSAHLTSYHSPIYFLTSRNLLKSLFYW